MSAEAEDPGTGRDTWSAEEEEAQATAVVEDLRRNPRQLELVLGLLRPQESEQKSPGQCVRSAMS